MDIVNILCRAVTIFANVLEVLIFVDVILSWLPAFQRTTFARVVYMLTKPILYPIEKMINKSPIGGPGMMINFSPIIAYFLIQAFESAAIMIILTVAQRL